MNKICKKIGCSKKHYGKGYCQKHWVENKQNINKKMGSICKKDGCKNGIFTKDYCISHNEYHIAKKNKEKNNICKFKGCNIGIYAKGYCRKHHAGMERGGYIKRSICRFPKCTQSIIAKSIYCSRHKKKISINKKYGFSPHSNKSCVSIALSGSNNPHWNGGVADYPNHYRMKLLREKIFKKVNGKCESCGRKAKQLHHKDFSKDIHEENNFMAVCYKCHKRLHILKNPKYKSKYRRLYGATFTELSERLGLSVPKLKSLHNMKKLDQIIHTHNKN